LERTLSLPLLDATTREVLRLHPPFPGIRRDLSRPMRLLGYDLPEGTRVVASIHLAQRRPQTWSDPDRFLAERFLAQRPTAFEWIPYGGGIRRCAGAGAVAMQLKVVLSAVLARAVLRPLPG